ncbi:TPA: hypothetical protein N0F65_005504 [Lagenidium giganteum]|uniref:Prokaryotic-type class I peptide chain release factors domain-containing protein n=1 Tax=Lagenidium giganteum TaxID=4803 RepID=A0AAV2YJI2_9STRA|nr:TPA: hypothetical protein N0F65_005504 [Lagenidium giganteum]
MRLLRAASSGGRAHAPPLLATGFARWFNDDKRVRQPVVLRDEDLEEQFVKGWGKGGQKINKVRNCVLLKHVPTGLHVRCQPSRSLEANRNMARRLLLQKLDDHINGDASKRNTKIDKLRRKKSKRHAKAKKKHAAHAAAEDADEQDDDESDDDEEDSASSGESDDSEDDDVEEHKFKSKKKK